jgi:hypothetical protein
MDHIYALVIEAVNSSKIAARYMAVTIMCPDTTEAFMLPHVSGTCHDYGKSNGKEMEPIRKGRIMKNALASSV